MSLVKRLHFMMVAAENSITVPIVSVRCFIEASSSKIYFLLEMLNGGTPLDQLRPDELDLHTRLEVSSTRSDNCIRWVSSIETSVPRMFL